MGSINNLGVVTAIGSSDSNFHTRKTSVQPSEDQAQLATVSLLAQVEQPPGMIDASSFQAVVSDAIRKLRAAASGSSDPVEAAYLSELANRFQRLEDAGNAGALPNSAWNPSKLL